MSNTPGPERMQGNVSLRRRIEGGVSSFTLPLSFLQRPIAEQVLKLIQPDGGAKGITEQQRKAVMELLAGHVPDEWKDAIDAELSVFGTAPEAIPVAPIAEAQRPRRKQEEEKEDTIDVKPGETAYEVFDGSDEVGTADHPFSLRFDGVGYAVATDKGRKASYKKNYDRVAASTHQTKDGEKYGLLVVSDGMGHDSEDAAEAFAAGIARHPSDFAERPTPNRIERDVLSYSCDGLEEAREQLHETGSKNSAVVAGVWVGKDVIRPFTAGDPKVMVLYSNGSYRATIPPRPTTHRQISSANNEDAMLKMEQYGLSEGSNEVGHFLRATYRDRADKEQRRKGGMELEYQRLRVPDSYTIGRDCPPMAADGAIPFPAGSIVIVGSDGLFDTIRPYFVKLLIEEENRLRLDLCKPEMDEAQIAQLLMEVCLLRQQHGADRPSQLFAKLSDRWCLKGFKPTPHPIVRIENDARGAAGEEPVDEKDMYWIIGVLHEVAASQPRPVGAAVNEAMRKTKAATRCHVGGKYAFRGDYSNFDFGALPATMHRLHEFDYDAFPEKPKPDNVAVGVARRAV
jgi:hypothetical protein